MESVRARLRIVATGVVLSCLGYLGTAAPVPAQLPPNLPYDGRPILARVRFVAVADPYGCQISDGLGNGGWSHDYPMSIQGIMKAATEVTSLEAPVDSVVTLAVTDPTFMKYPVAMVTEPGCWNPTEAEVRALRSYLQKGGFLLLDDLTFFDETSEHLDLSIARTEAWLQQVLPEGKPVPVPPSDPIFNGFFLVNAEDIPGGGTSRGGVLYGIYRDNDPTKALMIVATYRGVLGHNWRWVNGVGSGLGEGGSASGNAYRLGLNILVYSLSH